MHALPIHHLRREDAVIFGTEQFPLAKIARLTKCVPPGLLVSPPVDEVFAALVKHRASNLNEFERNKIYIRKTLLETEFTHHIRTEFEKENLILSQVWPTLVDKWLDQVHSIFIRYGALSKKDLELTTQAVFSIPGDAVFGQAFMDPLRDHVVISPENNLDFELQSELDRLVRISNSNLLIPHIYTYALCGRKVFLIKALPFTHSELSQSSAIRNLTNPVENIPRRKRALKLFMNLKEHFTVWEHGDGIVIKSENFTDPEKKLHALIESCITVAPRPVVYKFSVQSPSRLKAESEVVKFIKNKRSLHNIQICLSGIRSSDHLMEIKRDLASLGVARKGNLLFWLELTTPESLLNIESYIEAGIDGIEINTDILLSHLFGLPSDEITRLLTQKRALILIGFLKDPVKRMHRSEIPVILSGENAVLDEMIDFAIAHSIWGIELEEKKDYLSDQLSMKEFLNLRFGG